MRPWKEVGWGGRHVQGHISLGRQFLESRDTDPSLLVPRGAVSGLVAEATGRTTLWTWSGVAALKHPDPPVLLLALKGSPCSWGSLCAKEGRPHVLAALPTGAGGTGVFSLLRKPGGKTGFLAR